MVSVPWMTTAPLAPLPSAPLIAPASSNRSLKVRDAPGLRRKSTVRSSAPMAPRPGTAASSSGAERAGDTPPPGACVMAIVPPSPKTATRDFADSLISDPLPGRPLTAAAVIRSEGWREPFMTNPEIGLWFSKDFQGSPVLSHARLSALLMPVGSRYLMDLPREWHSSNCTIQLNRRGSGMDGDRAG